MKKKITLLALMLALIATLTVIFVVSVSADDSIKVTYEWAGGYIWETAKPNEDGSYTLRTAKKSNNATVTLADGTVVDKVFYGWYTKDGTLYEPGATVTFTQSTQLYEAYGIEVFTAEDLEAVKANNFVRLGADIVTDKDLYSNWGMSTYDFNGHTLTTTHNNQFMYNYRGGFAFIGKGSVIHQPSTVGTDDNQKAGIVFEHHGHGDWDTLQRCWIGKDITIETPYNLIRIAKDNNYDKCPDVHIFGEVKAKNLFRSAVISNATLKLYDSTKLTLTGNDPFSFTKETGINTYMNIHLDGEIILTDPNAVLLDDFIMSNRFGMDPITSGTYTVSSVDAERIAMFLPDTLMLKATENGDGTTTYSVVEADCVHNWILNEDLTVKPQPGETGLDVFDCSLCGTKKQTITVYSPKEVEITVTVRTEDGDKKYQVLAGEVLDFQFNGIGGAALCYINGLKDFGEFTSDKIVGIEVPAGVVELESFDNETLEEITILDGVSISVGNLSKFKALKTLNIGAATVRFGSVSSSCKLETINSTKEGATITFNSDCFKNVSAIKNLNMHSGSTYRFGGGSFNTSGLTKVIFPDDSNIIFDGDAAFYGSPNLKYAYFGTNCISDKKINRKPFDCCYALETVVLMDIVYISEYTFCCNGDFNSNGSYKEGKGEYKEALNVYSHNPDITFNDNTFANRKVLGVNLYTAGTGVTSLSNCVYTIYAGLAHQYTLETITESTCVTQGKAEYVTDCPCGYEYRNVAYTIYSTLNADLNGTAKEAFGTNIQDLPLSAEHTDSDIVNGVEFTNGYTNLGTKSFKCLYCDVTIGTEEEPSFPALFLGARYSVPEDGRLLITVSYSVNQKALEEYEALEGALEYGVVGAITEKLGGKAPLEATGVPVVKAPISSEYQSFDFIIGGFNDTQLDLGVTMCAYVYDGTKYVYIQETQVEVPTSVSYNLIFNS